MSTRRADARLLAPALTACLVLAACSSDPAPSPPSPDAPATTSASAAGEPQARPSRRDRSVPPVSLDVAGDLQRVLDQRALALLDADREGFVATLGPDAGTRLEEETYFTNLAQLPLTAVTYTVEPASLVRSGRGYWAVVEMSLQLEGYDAAPALSTDRFRFIGVGADDYRIVSTTDEAWERRNLGVQQPWDLEAIRVREGTGVLGVFDTATRAQRKALVRATERGIADVGARVPYGDWSRTAVFYALSDPAFLESFDDLPGGDPDDLDGLAFTVPGGADVTAATRFVLNPAVLSRRGRALGELVRHELTHVAVGPHDDGVPLWLSEGLAEWVSVQAVSPRARRVPQSALAAAEAGITAMPTDDDFNDDEDAETNYALAWWVCEWLAATYGPDAPWRVLDALATPADAAPDDEPNDEPNDEAVVRRLLGVSVDQLARRAGALMVSTYAEAEPGDLPSATG